MSDKKLRKLLIDRNQNKTDLRLAIGVSTATEARLPKDKLVTMDVLVKICKALNCNVGDILDVINDSETTWKINSDLRFTACEEKTRV